MPSSKYIIITMLPQALLLVTLLNINVASTSNIVKTLPGFRGDLPFKLETGYVGVGSMDDVQLFYYFFESEGSPEYDPLVLWLTGGPGCSAFSGLLYENLGPLSFDYAHSIGNKPKLKLNPYSWTKVANIIFLDAPVGTGFSYAKNWEGYSNLNDTLSAAQTYEFLRKWLMDHPKFYNNPLYITGDSYSGIIVPMVVQEISDGNQDEHVPPMNLKGYVLGNPVTDKKKDYNYKVLFAYLKALISDELYQSMKKNCKGEYINVDLNNTLCVEDLELYNECIEDIQSGQILEPSCTLVALPKSAGSKWNVNYFSDKDSVNLLLSFPELTRPWCRSYNYLFSYIWANDKTVQDALHIQEGSIKEWLRCNQTLQDSYISDVSSSLVYHENLIKQGYRVLIYSGDHDMVIPYVATMAWIESLNLTVDSRWKPWFVDGQVAGYRVQYSDKKYRLTYTTIKGAGHTAPEYKPEECHAMISRWFAYYPL
ncbi:LOW QUALITY PROTEIN: serine carboxypeptidase-like 13 [Prunus dulcis]|uniref:LOW QUALITY PROTEIN: serine carboxypeptidase-like 13 n=1 Tax=Prunus dulcis TaxID=3755 RepID=UPI001482976E|nr:LOW QUALITY PROTEIN: serine carboxypeptidase-like 13 [Prunus dulcis]